jgi:hypothetical protein
VTRTIAGLVSASSRRLAACFTKPSPSWPRVSWRPSGRSCKPALQAGGPILHKAPGASPGAAATLIGASSRRLAACFTKPSPSWPRVSWRPSGRSCKPAVQAGGPILHKAPGASPGAAATLIGASSRRLAACLTKPSPSWPRVSWRPSGRSRKPALQAGGPILQKAPGASPGAAATLIGASSRRLAPGGLLWKAVDPLILCDKSFPDPRGPYGSRQ